MRNIKIKRRCPLISLILIIFCFISVVFGLFFALGHFFARIQHEEKWKDYDECGIF